MTKADLQPLEPLDERMLIRFHAAGLDIVSAFVLSQRLRSKQAERAQLDEPRVVIRNFGSKLTVR